MNYLANKSLRFIADRFEEWSGGMCISQGPINAEITATADKNGVRFEVIGADNLRMCKHASFAPISEGGMSMDMGTRLQYFNPAFSEGDPLDLIVCHVFYEGRTISYIRFAMSFPDRIIEFYGNTVSFDGIDRPIVTSGQRYPSFKKLFIDDLADHYRLLLKENSVSIAIVDHQLACVAFCIKKYLAFLAMDNDCDGLLRDQIFKDVSSIISEFYPLFGDKSLDSPRNWFRQLIANPINAEAFMEYYYTCLNTGQHIDGWQIQNKFRLL